MFYAVSVYLKSVRSKQEPMEKEIWQLQIYLVEASNESEAIRKGAELGQAAEHDYEAADGVPLKWILDSVNSAFEIGSTPPKAGAELFSMFLRYTEVESMKKPFDDE